MSTLWRLHFGILDFLLPLVLLLSATMFDVIVHVHLSVQWVDKWVFLELDWIAIHITCNNWMVGIYEKWQLLIRVPFKTIIHKCQNKLKDVVILILAIIDISILTVSYVEALNVLNIHNSIEFETQNFICSFKLWPISPSDILDWYGRMHCKSCDWFYSWEKFQK